LGTSEHTNEKTYQNAILDNTNLGYMKRCHWFKHCQELLTLGTHLKLMVVTIHTLVRTNDGG
jgi:hypothetical protein